MPALAATWSANDCHIEKIAAEANLNTDELNAICEAAAFYNIDVHWKAGRTIVMIGEIHSKGQTAFRVGMNLVDKFSLRGLEFFPVERKWWHYPLIGMSYFGEKVINAYKWATFDSETIDQGSLMNSSYLKDHFLYFNGKEDVTYFNGTEVGPQPLQEFLKNPIARNQVINFHLERSKAVTDRITNECGESLAFTKYCDRNLIIGLRDKAMAHSIDQAFSLFPEHSKIVVMVGASHVPGISNLLNCRKGYQSTVVTRGISVQMPNMVPIDKAARTGHFCD